MAKRRRMAHSAAEPAEPAAARVAMPTLTSAVAALARDAARFEAQRLDKLRRESAAPAAPAAPPPAPDLLPPDADVLLVVTFRFPPLRPKLRPLPIPLKHALWKEGEHQVCLFVKDPQRAVKQHLAQHGGAGVSRVLGVQKLRKRYGTHEARRELSAMYDLFLVDRRVAPMMPNLLGTAFLHTKRMPLAVDMSANVVAAIRRALRSTAFAPRQGTCTAVKVATLQFEQRHVVDNVLAAMDAIVRRCPRGWDDIQSFSLKTTRSPAVHVYLSLPRPLRPLEPPRAAKKAKPSPRRAARPAHRTPPAGA